ncbi:BioY family transporter [Halobacillus andaensis]|uniref:Biotin transporter n=1 Tax=Halobacillus andaensis TaxID=1176239 RepID=A0A917B5S6_HALAA|nr:biotin transporter BioY [Halobacillus andaensis]MBP2004552.1 biotin transport system substrate-specific component [Halobacillus andaensis]GGF20790.1 BioY family transporter [Halobacillus andaensis]
MKRSRTSAYDMTIGAMFVALMAVGANITAVAPFLSIMNVPLTLQTFFAILAGIVLGSRLGGFAIFVYAALGIVGAPVFAEFSGGVSTIISPTFGFVLSFIVLAFIVGKIVENNRRFSMYMTASIIGVIINYFIGVNGMYAALNFWMGEGAGISYALAWTSMMPFLIKDFALALLAGAFAYRLEKGILHRTPLRQAV